MADISITAGNVVAGSGAHTVAGICGETITAGQAVYRDATDRKYYKADNNAAGAAARQPAGIALNGGSLNQPIVVQTSGNITIGASLTAGTTYYLSDTPGGICPLADVGSGEYVVIIGVATSTAILALGIKYSGVAL